MPASLFLSPGGVGGARIPEPQTTATARELHLFLLVGQSNMAGRGQVTLDRLEPIPGVMALQRDGFMGKREGSAWDKKVAGVGLARSFTQAYMRAKPGVTVGFIPAACGGSPVEAWVDGYYSLPTKVILGMMRWHGPERCGGGVN